MNLGASKVCSSCGFDNSNVLKKAVDVGKFDKSKLYISGWFLWVVYIQMFLSGLNVILGAVTYFTDKEIIAFPVASMIISGIVLIACIFILRLNKKAFIVFVAVSMVDIIMLLISGNIVAAIIRILFIVYIFKNDWQYFK